MSELTKCPSCGAIVGAGDTECKICGTSLDENSSASMLEKLPPLPDNSLRSGADTPDSAVTNNNTPSSKPPLAIPQEASAQELVSRDSRPKAEQDNTKKVPFSGKDKGASPSDPASESDASQTSTPSDPQANRKKTMMMMPALSSDDLKTKMDPASGTLDMPWKSREENEGGGSSHEVKPSTDPSGSDPSAESTDAAAEPDVSKTLLGVPSQVLISEEASRAADQLFDDEPAKAPEEGVGSPSQGSVPTELRVSEEDLDTNVISTDEVNEVNEEFQDPPKRPPPATSNRVPPKTRRLLLAVGIVGAICVVGALAFAFLRGGSEPKSDSSEGSLALRGTKKDSEAGGSGTSPQQSDPVDGAQDGNATSKSGLVPKDGESPGGSKDGAKGTSRGDSLALLGESSAKCKALSDYPAFPFKNHLSQLQEKLGAKGVCALFGNVNRAGIKAGFQHLLVAGPYDDDFRPDVSRLLVFPQKELRRHASHLEFAFYEDRLFEIRLNLIGSYPGKLSSKTFKKHLASRGRTQKDRLGRWYSKYKDENMEVYQIEKKVGKSKHKWVVFRDPVTRKKVDSNLKKKAFLAKKHFAEGIAFMSARKMNKALKSFRIARGEKPEFAMAHAMEAKLLIRAEKFKQGIKAANTALEKGRDQRAKATAHSLIAMVALHGRNKDKALDHLAKAESLDPANVVYSKAIDSLRTGEYGVHEVARTAARIACLGTVPAKKWTKKGILAQGYFPNQKTYKNALKKFAKKPAFKKAKRNSQQGACR